MVGHCTTMKSGKVSLDKKDTARREAAETLAISALAYLAAEPEALGGFLATTGIGPDQIRHAARDPEFLAGVLDYVLSDEPLLLAFAKHEDINPAEIQRARAAFGGVWERDVP